MRLTIWQLDWAARQWLRLRGRLSAEPRRAVDQHTITILLACVVGVLGGFGAAIFTWLIETISDASVGPLTERAMENAWWLVGLAAAPALGLVFVSWFTRRFAPEAQGHGVPEVITAVARHDGVIRARVALVKILASGVCIGTGGSIGREGPIVQIGAALGSAFGRWVGLTPRQLKVLVAAGGAAGISATFNAPLAGVMFASEIILGSFAVESLTPIVIASVLADVVQQEVGEHGASPAFEHLRYHFTGGWPELPSHLALGLVCGLAAVGFTKLLYATEDATKKLLPRWWLRSLVCGLLVGVFGVAYFGVGYRPFLPPEVSRAAAAAADREPAKPPLFGVGYEVVDHALRLENPAKPSMVSLDPGSPVRAGSERRPDPESRIVPLRSFAEMAAQFWWLLPLALLKPLVTSLTLGGGGSGGIFAPSLFIGATTGACFGLLMNAFAPQYATHPGVYAIVGMGAVVAGTTHGTLSAILIVYEMTGDYRIILPIMAAAGMSGLVARLIDHESIYEKKLSRRGESLSRAHDAHRLDHVMVRDVMIRDFPFVRQGDDLTAIVRTARANAHIECLPVMDAEGRLVGIIRPADLHRVLDTDLPPHLLNADDVALSTPVSLRPDENLLEALRDFGARDIETLPVESGSGKNRKLLGLLLRSDAMRRYREEMLRRD